MHEMMGSTSGSAQEGYFSAMESIPTSVYYWLAAAAVIGSAVLFLTGRRNWAMFVGQWPPTLLAVALLYKVLRPSRDAQM
jgi:hypothetical protein